MKFFKILLGIFIFANINLFPKFYSVKSQRELDLKIHDFKYSFICFAPKNQDGLHIKSVMKSLVDSDGFQNIMDYGLVVLFVYVNDKVLSSTQSFNFSKEQPLFVLLNKDEIIAQSDLGGHYTAPIMKKFVLNSLAKNLAPLLTISEKNGITLKNKLMKKLVDRFFKIEKR